MPVCFPASRNKILLTSLMRQIVEPTLAALSLVFMLAFAIISGEDLRSRMLLLTMLSPVWVLFLAVVHFVLSLTSTLDRRARDLAKSQDWRRTQPRLTRRFAIYVLHSLVVLVAMVLLFEVAVPSLLAGLETWSTTFHLAATAALLYLAAFGIMFWLKNKSKELKLLRIEMALSEITHGTVATAGLLQGEQKSEPVRQLRLASTHRLLDHVLFLVGSHDFLMDAPSHGRRAAKTAWIYLLTHDARHLRCVHLQPYDQSYAQLAENYCPASSLEFQNSGTAPGVAPLTLQFDILHSSGPKAYATLESADYLDLQYREHLERDALETHAFRSAAGIRLQLGSEPVGVLVVSATVSHSFREADALPLKIFGNLLTHLVMGCERSGCYADSRRVYS